MKRISDNHTIFTMSRDNAPVYRITSGSDICLDTKDCFNNRITSVHDKYDSMDWDNINPSTGPIYVEGAEPGDILRVEIKSLKVTGNQAVMVTASDFGILSDETTDTRIHIIPLKDNYALLPGGVRWPLHPMIGVIGVAPAGDPVSCGTPGDHGGNMDCKIIEEGCTVWLPVNVEGALFALGDLHAAMGDGETVCGLEVPGEVIVNLSVVKGAAIPTPMVTTATTLYALASAPTSDEAASRATHHMAHFLVDHSDISVDEAACILSIAGDVQVCQIVDPQKTCRIALPRTVADQLGIRLGLE